MNFAQSLCRFDGNVWRFRGSDEGRYFRLDLEELLLGPGVEDESSILLIAETFPLAFDADLAAGPLECTLNICKISCLREWYAGVQCATNRDLPLLACLACF